MALNKATHTILEIDGVRCSVVEENVSKARVDFLTKVLTHNGFEVKTVASEEGDTLTVGVTDVMFNPVIYVYELRLKTPDNKIVTPQYWLQETKDGIKKGEQDLYWE
jgi:hypothetical protein